MSWTHPARIGWGLFRPVEVRSGVILEVSFVLSLRSRQRPRASPPDHSRITHSRHRTALGGHQRTRGWSISYSRGRRGSLSDAGRHDSDTVRDREASGDSKLDVLVRIQYAAALNRSVSLGVVSY